ncbi:MAG: hypothetical protein PHD32_01965 [Eubacteriales bacterium]|nr:hypothetical protein [Eubacteriales bacterium]
MHKRMDTVFLVIAAAILAMTGCAVPGDTTKHSPSPIPNAADEPPAGENALPILEFVAAERAKDEISLQDAVMLQIAVSYCEYAEPTQYITDEKIIAQAREAFSDMKVTGLADKVSSTGGSESYIFLDAQDNVVGSFSFQSGLLLAKDGRYSVEGRDALCSIEGIKLTDQWKEYWEAQEELKSDYEWNYQISYPASVFELSGYSTNLLYQDIDLADLVSITVSISRSDVKSFTTTDKEEIKAIYSALRAMQVTGMTSSGAVGQKWYITFGYQVPGEKFFNAAYLSFYGNCLISDFAQGGDTTYAVSGLEALFDAVDAETLKYLKEHRTGK